MKEGTFEDCAPLPKALMQVFTLLCPTSELGMQRPAWVLASISPCWLPNPVHILKIHASVRKSANSPPLCVPSFSFLDSI